MEHSQREIDGLTRLLEDYHRAPVCGAKHCNHGTFSPHVFPHYSASSNTSITQGSGARHVDDLDDNESETRDGTRGLIGDDGLSGGSIKGTYLSITKWLAGKQRVKHQRAV